MPPAGEWASLVPGETHRHLAAGGRRPRAARGRLRAAAAGLPPHRRRRRQRALPLSHRPLGAAAADARLLLHDGLRRPRAGRGDGAQDPRVPQADPRSQARRGPLSRARARGLRVGPRDPRGRDRGSPRALRPAPLGDGPGAAVGASGARSDACSGSGPATFRPTGGSSAPTSADRRAHPRAAPRPSRKCSTRSPSPPRRSSRAHYRPLWAITRPAARSCDRPGHRRPAPGDAACRFGIPWSRGRELELRALAGRSGPPPP